MLMNSSFKENSTSALLRLPQELKDRIYELACGGELLHISYRPPENKFYNYICQAPVSDQQVYEDFSTAKGCWNPLLSKVDLRISKNPNRLWKSSESVYQHEHCLEMRTGGLLLGLPSLSLSLLRVCRQTYHEARLVPISENTFAFEDPYILRRFITRISSIHRRTIRSVQLDVMLDSARVEKAWNSAVFFVIVPRLRNLRNVDICIDLADYHTLIPDDRVSDPQDGAWMSDLLCLRHLPLKNATVVIRDKENSLTAWPNDTRWPLEQKQRWARFIRDRILRLDGVVSDEDDKVNSDDKVNDQAKVDVEDKMKGDKKVNGDDSDEDSGEE